MRSVMSDHSSLISLITHYHWFILGFPVLLMNPSSPLVVTRFHHSTSSLGPRASRPHPVPSRRECLSPQTLLPTLSSCFALGAGGPPAVKSLSSQANVTTKGVAKQ